jgi:membrane AbrB-like protein
LFSFLLAWAQLPAALMLGPLLAGIVVESMQASIRLPRLPFSLAQGIIGCLVAEAMTPAIVHSFALHWPFFLAIVFIMILFNCSLGWAISTLGILPGTAAIWGLLPGAASAMMIMAEGYGADSRLVAFMQYMRVVIVAVLASMVARFWVHTTAMVVQDVWFPALHWLPFLETLAIILGGIVIGHLSRLPAGMLLVPLFAGAALHLSGLVEIELPRWLLAAGYVCIGWQTGLRFTRDVLAHAVRALPAIAVSIMTVIAFCGGIACVLVKLFGIDPLTAYLATSPGGVNAVAIIAASTKVDVPFVMALQSVRLLLVLFIGPVLSRFAASRITLPVSV